MYARPLGAHSLRLELSSLEAVARWRALVIELVAAGLLAPPVDLVPGARTLLLDGVDPVAAAQLLAEHEQRALPSTSAAAAGLAAPVRLALPSTSAAEEDVVEVPVIYDGADLAEVARIWQMTERQVVARHTGTEFTVAFCGFAPGFPYLVGLGGQMPRRATARPTVPAGSVGLAGSFCGIYPSASPGGWQLLGRTDACLFDPDRTPPALLPPGTRVRFVEVAPGSPPLGPAARAARAEPGQPSAASPSAVGAGPDRDLSPSGWALLVVRPGALTTVQDAGRVGLAHLGVPRAGPLDSGAAKAANRLVGNLEDAAVLETTLTGAALRAAPVSCSTPPAAGRILIAVTGAEAAASVAGRPVPRGVPVQVGAGELLDIGPARRGVRSYLAVAGGIAVAPVLGSRSRDTLAGIGPAPLTVGARLPVGDLPKSAAALQDAAATPPAPHLQAGAAPPAAGTPAPSGPVRLRLTPGPHEEWFGPEGLACLLSAPYALSPHSNRIGARLSGMPVPRRRAEELESEGMVLGAVQVPPDGQPVVLLADHPTTGGYPVIGVVDPRDLDGLAQVRPGAAVQFVPAAAGAGGEAHP
ncbi:MAG TPA: 5-oxoprolinase/urea amidolyase family protein [Mycobacteriales bacterium]|nr:5-oxoprolinase/urea amidolyase family protein [Mycobacteriales bacterium]